LQFFGKRWGVLDDSGELGICGIIISVVFVLLTLTFTIVKTLADVKNEDGKFRGQTMLNQLLEEINASKRIKLNKYIEYAANTNVGEFITIITPDQQIKDLCNNLQNIINNLFGIDKSKIGLSIVYYINKKWEWLHKLNVDDDLNIDQLTTNPNTSLFQIISSKSHVVFWADKKEGITQQQFVASELDKSYNNAGSIYCADISIKKDKTIILPAVLSLTTYDQMLCLPTDNKTINYLTSMIMPAFQIRIELELCLLYIKLGAKEDLLTLCKDEIIR
jgi:hypothetical protein